MAGPHTHLSSYNFISQVRPSEPLRRPRAADRAQFKRKRGQFCGEKAIFVFHCSLNDITICACATVCVSLCVTVCVCVLVRASQSLIAAVCSKLFALTSSKTKVKNKFAFLAFNFWHNLKLITYPLPALIHSEGRVGPVVPHLPLATVVAPQTYSHRRT